MNISILVWADIILLIFQSLKTAYNMKKSKLIKTVRGIKCLLAEQTCMQDFG